MSVSSCRRYLNLSVRIVSGKIHAAAWQKKEKITRMTDTVGETAKTRRNAPRTASTTFIKLIKHPPIPPFTTPPPPINPSIPAAPFTHPSIRSDLSLLLTSPHSRVDAHRLTAGTNNHTDCLLNKVRARPPAWILATDGNGTLQTRWDTVRIHT